MLVNPIVPIDYLSNFYKTLELQQFQPHFRQVDLTPKLVDQFEDDEQVVFQIFAPLDNFESFEFKLIKINAKEGLLVLFSKPLNFDLKIKINLKKIDIYNIGFKQERNLLNLVLPKNQVVRAPIELPISNLFNLLFDDECVQSKQQQKQISNEHQLWKQRQDREKQEKIEREKLFRIRKIKQERRERELREKEIKERQRQQEIKELRDQQIREFQEEQIRQAKEQQIREFKRQQKLRENEIRRQQKLKEQQLKEQQLKEQQLKEQKESEEIELQRQQVEQFLKNVFHFTPDFKPFVSQPSQPSESKDVEDKDEQFIFERSHSPYSYSYPERTQVKGNKSDVSSSHSSNNSTPLSSTPNSPVAQVVDDKDLSQFKNHNDSDSETDIETDHELPTLHKQPSLEEIEDEEFVMLRKKFNPSN